jgi:hypothetical protein
MNHPYRYKNEPARARCTCFRSITTDEVNIRQTNNRYQSH